MQSITTRYIPATNTRPARIKAENSAGGSSVTVSWEAFDDHLDTDQKHAEAARRLADQLSWSGTWTGGCSPCGRGYTFVCSRGMTSFRVS